MTDEEVVALLKDETSKLNLARRVFSGQRVKLEVASGGRRILNPIEMRRMEFEAVRKIADALGVKV